VCVYVCVCACVFEGWSTMGEQEPLCSGQGVLCGYAQI